MIPKYKHLWFAILFISLALVLLRATLSSGQILGEDYAGALSLWGVWFPWHALTHNLDMAFTDYLAFPVEVNITLLLSPISTLFYHLLNIFLPSLLAFNLLFPLYVALTGWLSFLFARRYIKNELFALAAALVIAFNPLTFSLAEDGTLILLGLFVFPLWLLAWQNFLDRPRVSALAWVVMATYAVILMALQFSNLMLTFLLPLAVWQFRESKTRWAQIVDYMVLGGLILGVLLLIHPLPIIYRATYLGIYEPISLVYVFETIWIHTTAWKIFLWSGAALILLAVSLWSDSGRMRWLTIIGINTACYTAVEFAPLTLLASIFNVPGAPQLTPKALFLFPIIFGGCLLVFQWLATLQLDDTHRITLYAAIGAAIIGGSGWWQSLPTREVKDYEFYRSLTADSENYLVIDVKWGLDSWVYAPQHHKRVFGVDFEDHTLDLLLLQGKLEGEPQQLAEDIRQNSLEWRAAYIVFHLDEFTSEAIDPMRGWLEWSGAYCMAGTEDDIEIWRAAWHPAGCTYGFSMGGPASELGNGEGWWPSEVWDSGPVRWAGSGVSSRLMLWAFRPAGDYTLQFRAATLAEIENQRVEVLVNDESLGEFDLGVEFAEISVTIPRELIGARGLLDVELRHDTVLAFEGRELTAIYESIALEPN